MPRPKKSGPEFRSSDREVAKKMLREYFQQKGGAEYMRNAQQPSMFQDTKTGEYIARPQAFGAGGTLKYRSGGMMKYENGGPAPVDNAGESEVKVMVKDSYNTATNPQPGKDYIIMVEGQPTDYAISDMPNFFRSEGLGGPQLENVFYEFLDQFPKGSRTAEEEQAYRKEQFNKALSDVGNIAEGRPYGEAVTPGAFAKENLGNVIRDVTRGGAAAPGAINYNGRYSPTGQKGTPKGINTDDFLRVLANQFRQ